MANNPEQLGQYQGGVINIFMNGNAVVNKALEVQPNGDVTVGKDLNVDGEIKGGGGGGMKLYKHIITDDERNNKIIIISTSDTPITNYQMLTYDNKYSYIGVSGYLNDGYVNIVSNDIMYQYDDNREAYGLYGGFIVDTSVETFVTLGYEDITTTLTDIVTEL